MGKELLRATPAARSLSKHLGLDLSLIPGTGANGRIHKEDVEAYKAEASVKISPVARAIAEKNGINWREITNGSGFKGKIMKADILALLSGDEGYVKPAKEKDFINQEKTNVEQELSDKKDKYGEIEVIPMSSMRKVIAKRMVESYLTAPTFTLNYDIDMTEVLALRKKLLDPILEQTGKKVTVTDIISLAVIKTLLKHKFLNSSLTPDGQNIICHNYVNLSMAVGFDGGLLTPVVYNAEKMSLSELVVALKDVTTRALEMKLAPSELQGSTFTISNLGMYGVSSFGPIINQPNSAILGVSATIEKPTVVNGEIKIRPIMSLGLTIDHRVVDGLAGAKFMKDLKNLLENPLSMLI